MPLSKCMKYTFVFFHVNYFFTSEYNMRLHTQRMRGCFWTKDTLLTRESISGNDRADLQTENNTEDHAVREYHKFTDRDLGTTTVVSKCGFPD